MKTKHHIVKKAAKAVMPLPPVGELAVASIMQAIKQMRTEIAGLPNASDKIKEQREFIVQVMAAIPEVRRKASILVLHTSDQIMADIAAIAKPEDRMMELKTLLKLYLGFVEQPKSK